MKKNKIIIYVIIILLAIIITNSLAIYQSSLEGTIEADLADTIAELITTEESGLFIDPDNTQIEYNFSVRNFKYENGEAKINEVLSTYYLKIDGLEDSGLDVKLYFIEADSTTVQLSLETTGDFIGYYKAPHNLAIGEQQTENYVLVAETQNPTNQTLNVSIDLGYSQIIGEQASVNVPELVGNMVPVVFDGTTNTWKIVSESSLNWYDYSNQKWANVIIATNTYNGTNSYTNAPVGTAIPYSDIISMYVWIPRFVYRINPTYYHNTVPLGTTSTEEDLVDIHFSKTEVEGGDEWDDNIYVVDESDNSVTSAEAWTTCSAFDFGDTYLNGFWVAKFQASDSSGASTASASDRQIDHIYSRPSKYVETNMSADEIFLLCRNMETDNIHGWSISENLQTSGDFLTDTNNLNTHLIKNSEWAAITFLTHSRYGIGSKGVNQYALNSQGFISGSNLSETTVFTTNGKKTTSGNEYGIYGMASSVWEGVAGYIDSGNNMNSPVLYAASSKYKNVYPIDVNTVITDKDSIYSIFENIKGAAIWEVSTNGNISHTAWFAGRSNIGRYESSNYKLLITRGGGYSQSNGEYDVVTSVFSFGYADGSEHGSSRTFRPVISIGTGI